MTSTPLRGPEVPLTVECLGCRCLLTPHNASSCRYCGETPYCPTCARVHEQEGAPCFPKLFLPSFRMDAQGNLVRSSSLNMQALRDRER